MSGEIEKIFFFLARRGQSLKVLRGDDHMAGRAGHAAFAGAFERLVSSPRGVEQPFAVPSVYFPIQAAVRPEKTHKGHG